MAVLALAVAGYVAGAAVPGALGLTVLSTGWVVTAGAMAGSMLGAFAGSYIDNNYLFPPQTPEAGNQIKAVSVTVGAEGSPATRILGDMMVGGCVIWMGPVVGNEEEV